MTDAHPTPAFDPSTDAASFRAALGSFVTRRHGSHDR